METPVEIDDAISSSEVRRIIDGIQEATSTTFQEGQYYKMVRTEAGSKTLDDKSQQERVSLYRDLRSRLEVEFENSKSEYFVRKTGVMILKNTEDETGNRILRIYSNTGQDDSGRIYAICFVLNFGHHEEELKAFIDQTKENPLFIKSAMERVFSPDGDPTKTVIGGNMEYGKEGETWKNLSPFIRLKSQTPIFVKIKN